MVAEFNWWLLIVGVVAGGVLTWLVLADTTRREREIADEELLAEAAWITKAVGGRVAPDVAEDVLRAHRRYLGFPPPDVLVAPEDLPALEADGLESEPPADLVEPVPGAVAHVDSAPDAAGSAPVGSGSAGSAPDAAGSAPGESGSGTAGSAPIGSAPDAAAGPHEAPEERGD
jgi:hypothetical protein